MSTILVIIGIFAGIGVFLAMMYSLTQILLLRGPGRLAHGASFAMVMVIMTVLYLWRDTGLAQLLGWPLVPIALWTLWVERGWYRIFPLLVLVFAIMLALGYVALNPI